MIGADISEEWRQQAVRDLSVAKLLAAGTFYEWAAYAAQQAAEKAIKAARHALAIDLHNDNERSHKLAELAAPLREVWPTILAPSTAQALLILTNHEADGRYPALRSGSYRAPMNAYDDATAYRAILVAEAVVARCSHLVRELQGFWSTLPP